MNKLNPLWWLGNQDDPKPPADMWPDKPEWYRKVLWFFRNPFHNFTFYVIGMADHMDCRLPNTVFNPKGGCNIILPFFSYTGKVNFYFGWRERGNFGIKLTTNKGA